MLAAALTRELGCSVDTAFRWIAFLVLPLAVGVVALLFLKLRINSLLLVPVLFGYPLARSFQLICLPDLFYTLLLGVFILLLAYRRFILAALMLVVLFCARESTVVLGLVTAAVVAVAHRSASPRQAPLDGASLDGAATEPVRKGPGGAGIVAIFLLATAAGMLLNHHVAAKAAGNIHQINPLVYLLAKAPYNFLQNIVGVRLWSNTYIMIKGDHPLIQWALPPWMRQHSGAITHVGINDFSLSFPADYVIAVLCSFGVLLTALIKELRDKVAAAGGNITGRWRRYRAVVRGVAVVLRPEPVAVRVAAVYGMISLLIVPILGSAVLRYVFYAWPAFWLWGAGFFQRQYLTAPGRNRPYLAALLAIHLILVWLPLSQGWRDAQSNWAIRSLVILAVAIVLHWVVWRLLDLIRQGSGV
jgi:hypothetical protein